MKLDTTSLDLVLVATASALLTQRILTLCSRKDH
jgi:hypothetical protein